MGLSILIPTYNSQVKDLVEALLEQAKSLKIPFEILLLDDCSELSNSYINLKLNQLENVNYEVLTENVGRSKIRNLLFEKASYNNCLIMDGDVAIVRNNFLKKYWNYLQENKVVVGGHVYSKLPPLQKDKYLHWLYGTRVEVLSLDKRKKYAYSSFKTVCFGIKKDVFQQINFDENINGYGHEDTLFGIALEKKNIKIKHIDNPVLHLGIDKIDDFLGKQKMAIYNLKKLYKNNKLKSSLKKKIKLIKIAEIRIISFLLKRFREIIKLKLYSEKPSILVLQIQKIIWWNQIN